MNNPTYDYDLRKEWTEAISKKFSQDVAPYMMLECGFSRNKDGHCWSDDKTYCIICGHKKVEE